MAICNGLEKMFIYTFLRMPDSTIASLKRYSDQMHMFCGMLTRWRGMIVVWRNPTPKRCRFRCGLLSVQLPNESIVSFHVY